MKPASLLGIALELLREAAIPGPLPADARAGRFFRARRFLGSHDRRFLSEVLYAWLRHGGRAAARWRAWAERFGPSPELSPAMDPGQAARLCELVALAEEGRLPWSLRDTLAAARDLFGPPPGGSLLEALLANPESAQSLIPADALPTDPRERLAAELSLPPWLAERLVAERGEAEARALAAAFSEPASVDLRVNLSRATREEVRRALEDELGTEVTPTPLSPAGLRIARRIDLRSTSAWQEGWLEVEDEGSQLIVFALEASPPMIAIDACAGTGGKTLALADILSAGSDRSRASKSLLLAADVHASRLERLKIRARRARLAVPIRALDLDRAGNPPGSLPQADLVLLDVPCSGLGALRRRPEAKWHYGPEDIGRFQALQAELLERWSKFVRPGGRLAYATCSLLRAENEDVARAFAERHPEFRAVESAWARERLPGTCFEGSFLRFDPVRTGTDGFFLAIWEKTG